MTDKQKGLLFISGTILSWGLLAIILKVVNQNVDSFTIVWSRFAVAYLILSFYLFFKNKKLLLLQTKPPKKAILAASFLALNYIGYMKGVELTSPSNAQVMIQLGPLTLALMGIYYFKETLSKKQISGFILALLGFGLFYQEQIHSFFSQKSYNQGIFWIIIAALAWALYALVQKILVEKFDSRSLNLITYAVPTLIFFPFINLETLLSLKIEVLMTLFILGLNTIIAYGCLTEAFKYLPANQISILITLNPLITIFLMLLLNYFHIPWAPKESIGILGLIGALFVLIGAIMVVSKKKISNQ